LSIILPLLPDNCELLPSYHSAFSLFCQPFPEAFTAAFKSVATRSVRCEAMDQTCPSN
jgi:hypothetical protein